MSESNWEVSEQSRPVRRFRRHFVPSFVVACLLVALAPTAGSGPLCKGGCGATVCDEFVDDFETDRGWTKFEELVGEETSTVHCYAKEVGTAEPSPTAARAGQRGFLVYSNATGSHANNHVMGHIKLDDRAQKGKWTYEAAARIDDRAGHAGLVGPELSLQNTETSTSGCNPKYQTVTAGLQYLVGENKFNYWTTVDARGKWATAEQTIALVTGKWSTIRMIVDFDAHTYVSVTIATAGGDIELTEIAGKPLGIDRDKFSEEAFWATLEAQARWNSCDSKTGYNDSLAVTQFAVSYDDVAVRRLKAPTPGR